MKILIPLLILSFAAVPVPAPLAGPNADPCAGPVAVAFDPAAPVNNPVYVPAARLLGRLATAEYTAIRQAAAAQLATGNGQLELWLDMARTAQGGVNLNDPATVAAKAALVAAALLTAARADAVFAP